MATILKNRKSRIPLLLRPLYRLKGVLALLLRQQQFHLNLTLLALLGIILSIGLVTNASFFSAAVDRVILGQELQDFSKVTHRPPFSTNVYVFPSARSPLPLQRVEELSAHIVGTMSGEIGLPLRHQGMTVSSGSMMLTPQEGSTLYGLEQNFLGSVKVVYATEITDHIVISDGEPMEGAGRSGETVNVWIHERLAQEMGVDLGELFNIQLTLRNPPIPIRLAGFWHAKDPVNSEFWFTNPDIELRDALLVSRDDYLERIQPAVPAGTREASWYIILDETKLIPKDSAKYLAGFKRTQTIINQYLPGVRLNTPPLDPLESFVQRSFTLTILLLAYNLPAFGILLYFLGLTSGIIAQWQRQETSILVSRGMNLSGVLNLVLLEQLMLFVIAIPLGVGFGMLIAWLMGYTSSFLSFAPRPPLPISMEGLNPWLTILALSFALLTRLWPAAQVTKQSVVTEEREWARPMQGPFWYRYYLDLLLLLPTFYAYDQMTKNGSLAGLVLKRTEDLYQDPLLILVPALFVVTASLVMMRLFSLVMRLIDILANLTPSVMGHLALRQLGRQSHEYIQPMLLVIVSLSMGIYTLSMAASLDTWLVDRQYYRAGADYTFPPQPLLPDTEYSDGNWIPLPQEFTKAEGVLAATRFGDYPARIKDKEGREIWGRFIAIDRLDYPTVGWFRSDFADEPLGGLMNRLALAADGVLVPRRLLELSEARIGDKITVQVDIADLYRTTSEYTITGAFDYFPTVYEEEDPAVIGSLDYLTSLIGFTPPHDIWLKTRPDITYTDLIKTIPAATGVMLYAESSTDTRALVAKEQAKMERVGIFGTLSVGYLAMSFMAVLGLLIYSYASLRARMFRFSVLNAIGLLRSQIIGQVVMEYAFLAIFGGLAGAFIGTAAGRLFVPFFRFTGEEGIPLPPLLPLVPEQAIQIMALVFAVIVILAEVITVTLALRRRLVRVR